MRRLALCIALALGTVSFPALALSQDPPAVEQPASPADPVAAATTVDEEKESTPKEVAESVGAVVDATRTGSWIAIAGAVIMLLMNLFRLPWLGSLTKKIPKRWRIVVPIVLGGIAGILASVAGGVPWYEAVAVGLFSGPTAVFAHESVVEAIIGKREKDAAASPT